MPPRLLARDVSAVRQQLLYYVQPTLHDHRMAERQDKYRDRCFRSRGDNIGFAFFHGQISRDVCSHSRRRQQRLGRLVGRVRVASDIAVFVAVFGEAF